MTAGFVKEIDAKGPLDRARRDFEEAARLRPQWREPWDGVGIASMGCAGESFARGDFDGARALYVRAHDAFRKVVGMLANEIDPALVGNREMTAESAALATALAEVCAAPADARAAKLADVGRRFEGARLPSLPLPRR